MTTTTRRIVGRLLAAAGGSALATAYLSRSIAALRREVSRLGTAARQHEANRRAARVRLSRTRSRLSEVEDSQARIRASARRLRSSAVDAEHLRSVLPLRAAALRTMRDATASAREEAFGALSSAYASARRAWSSGQRPAGLRTISSAGLTWSLPASSGGGDALSGRIERGWLPLDDIAIVRSCAVGGIMLDIGANVGTTCIPRAVLGDFECVYAAEPDPSNYSCLVGNVIDNGLGGRVLPDPVALAGWTGTAHLEQARGIGTHHLVTTPEDARGDVTTVPCFTIDAWLERLGIAPPRVTFVKIDAQGWDVEILKSAASLLQRKHVVWQLEIGGMLKRGGSTAQAFADFVCTHFTHAKEMGRRSSGVEPVEKMTSRLDELFEKGAFANVLLLNRA